MMLNLKERNTKTSETGIFSKHVGAYFADHYGTRPGAVMMPGDLRYNRHSSEVGNIMPVVTFSEEALSNGEHNTCMMLSGKTSNKSILEGYQGGAFLNNQYSDYWHYDVQIIVEPRPLAESKLSLSNQKCPLGLNKLKLKWALHEDDIKSAYQLFSRLGSMLSTHGMGRSQITRSLDESLNNNFTGSCHHMGTTRMAKYDTDGVVDQNLKVFGLENLFISSSSVFPRYGYSNPTMTIVALSLRLADQFIQSRN